MERCRQADRRIAVTTERWGAGSAVGIANGLCESHELLFRKGRSADKVLKPGRRTNVVGRLRLQRVGLGLVEPNAVFRGCINVDDHDVAPVGCSAVAIRAVDAEGCPQ
jgi:hypothetical protein